VALSREAFAALLARLDPDPDRAGEGYEDLRLRLVKFFQWRQARSPEDLADETIDRVSRRLQEDPAIQPQSWPAYVHGFARNVLREEWKRQDAERDRAPAVPLTAPPAAEAETSEHRLACLDRCLAQLSADNRSLILAYYELQRGAQIEHRRRVAEAHGLPLNALRLRVHRIRGRLEVCVRGCLARPQPAPTSFREPATLQGGPVRA
jgi:DNA-directed RNA polymerase specialized sigma24 family protein